MTEAVKDWDHRLRNLVAAGGLLAAIALVVLVASDRFDDRAGEALAFFVTFAVLAAVAFVVARFATRRRTN